MWVVSSNCTEGKHFISIIGKFSLKVILFNVADSLIKRVGCVYFIVMASNGPQVLLGKCNVTDKVIYCLMTFAVQSVPKIWGGTLFCSESTIWLNKTFIQWHSIPKDFRDFLQPSLWGQFCSLLSYCYLSLRIGGKFTAKHLAVWLRV
jgi:hypothetical protein